MNITLKSFAAAVCAVCVSALSGCNIEFEDESSGKFVNPLFSEEQSRAADASSAAQSYPESSPSAISSVPALSLPVSSAAGGSFSAPVSSSAPVFSDAANPPEEPYEQQNPESAGIVLIVPEGKDYRGMYCFDGSPRQGEIYAGYINRLKEQLGGDIKLYSMNVPTACEFYCPEKYKKSCGITSQKEFIESEWRTLVDVIKVNAYKVYEEHRNENITLKTDHHWSPLGAYYCAQAFAEAAGVPFDDLSRYDEYVQEEYVGSHYYYSDNSPKIGDHPEKFVYYVPKADYTATEYAEDDYALQNGTPVTLVRMGNVGYYRYCPDDTVKRHVKTNVGNGRTLMIIKDSYGDALLPMLLGSFEEIWFTDLRFLDCNAADFAKSHGVTDVLVCLDTMVSRACGSWFSAIL